MHNTPLPIVLTMEMACSEKEAKQLWEELMSDI